MWWMDGCEGECGQETLNILIYIASSLFIVFLVKQITGINIAHNMSNILGNQNQLFSTTNNYILKTLK